MNDKYKQKVLTPEALLSKTFLILSLSSAAVTACKMSTILCSQRLFWTFIHLIQLLSCQEHLIFTHLQIPLQVLDSFVEGVNLRNRERVAKLCDANYPASNSAPSNAFSFSSSWQALYIYVNQSPYRLISLKEKKEQKNWNPKTLW